MIKERQSICSKTNRIQKYLQNVWKFKWIFFSTIFGAGTKEFLGGGKAATAKCRRWGRRPGLWPLGKQTKIIPTCGFPEYSYRYRYCACFLFHVEEVKVADQWRIVDQVYFHVEHVRVSCRQWSNSELSPRFAVFSLRAHMVYLFGTFKYLRKIINIFFFQTVPSIREIFYKFVIFTVIS